MYVLILEFWSKTKLKFVLLFYIEFIFYYFYNSWSKRTWLVEFI